MKKSFILLIALLITSVIFGQEKRSSFTFFGGSDYSLDRGIYNYRDGADCGTGENTYHDVQNRGLVLIHAGFLYQYRLCQTRLSLILGAGFNRKGYRETGELRIWQEDTWNHYSEIVKFNYFGFMGGFSYSLVQKDKLKVAIGLLANPETRSRNKYYRTLKPYALGGRCFVSLEYKVCSRSSVVIMPFFQTALMAYSEVRFNTGVYRPRSAGISIGLTFF